MRKLLRFTMLLSVTITLAACNRQCGKQAAPSTNQSSAAVSISLEGEVASSNFSASDLGAYQVNIKIKNVGQSTIQFDKIVGGFYSKRGKPFLIAITPYDVREEKVVELVPGAIYTAECKLDDPTDELLMVSIATDTPLQFSVVIYLKGQKITAPFTAELPSLVILHPYEPSRGTGQPLSFRNEEPYKYIPNPDN